MKRYKEYKTSTIRWLDRIPNDWKEARNKNLFLVCKKVAGKTSDQYKVLSLTLKGIIYRDLESNSGKMPKDFDGYQVVLPRSIILCLFDMDVTPRVVGYSPLKGIISSAYTVIVPKNDSVDPQFFAYWFLAMDYNKALLAETKGLRNTIRNNEFLSLKSVCPSIETQKEIVSYLDRTLEKVDYFIKQKQKYIELLKEYKQSKINELVTKGLDPNVKMKDSGIEWLGQIPEHWGLHRLKFLLLKPLQYGANESGEARKEGSLRYIRITDFSSDNELSDSNPLYLNKEKAANYILNEGDLLLARSGATAGKVFICRSLNEPSCYAGYLIRATSNRDKILPEYLYRFCQSLAYQNWISYTFIKSTIENVSAFKYANLSVLHPSLKEQNEIIEKIGIVDSKYKSLIQTATREISTIRKYRQSLVYELVTGIRKP